MNRWTTHILVAAAVGSVAVGTAVHAGGYTDWEPAQKIDEIDGNSAELNTPSLDGCPIQAPDGLSLYLASNRPGGLGGIDIWVAHRSSQDDPWGAPENLGEPVNSAADDFCPTPVPGNRLFFVSREPLPGSCGMGDIYLTRLHPVKGWLDPTHLACAPTGPNTALDEQGPSYFEADGRAWLYFSSGTPAVPGDIFSSEQTGPGSFGPATPVAGLNGAANDIQPNVRKDGLEVVFSSNRSGTFGLQDVWIAHRDDVDDPWSTPVNVGPSINSGAAETRPSLSWDARQLLFGRAPGPEGMSDVYVATRERDR